MKISLVDELGALPTLNRTPFEHCPLCGGQESLEARPEGAPEGGTPGTPWLVCETCGHLFCAEYPVAGTGPEAPAPPFERSLRAARRREAGSIVHRVCQLRGSVGGLWLETELGDGALLGAAHEFGFDVLGLSHSAAQVEHAQELGLESRALDLLQLEGEELFDVVSLVGCLERSPFPAVHLERARELLRPDGVLFVRTPNVDSALWRELDRRGENPHWDSTEVVHGFSREHLYWVLRQQGFEPCDFRLSEGDDLGMDVCAVRAEDLAPVEFNAPQ